MKKCVVIGSGLGGLSCGCILAKNGYEVTVLERSHQIGGCLQCFRRGDAIFETGMHYIGCAEPGQTVHTMLHYLGADKDIKLSRLNPLGYDVISFKGEHYHFANGKDNFIDQLAYHFPDCRDEITKYYDLVKLVASSLPMHSLNLDADLNIGTEYQMKSVNEVIDSVVSNPLLRQVLVGNLPLYAGEKNCTPFSTHALITDFYEQSAFRIVQGSSTLADSLANSIKEMGGRVLTQHCANKIECSESSATGVITSNGEYFPADLVISAIHPARTLDLVDSHFLRPAYRRRIKNIRNTSSSFTVYLKFRKNRVKYMNHNLYYYRSDSVWGCEKYEESSWPKCILYMHFCHEENPQYAISGEIISYMNFEETEQWLGTKVGHRGDSYEAFKRAKAEKLIDALEEEVPGIRDDIEQYYTSSPLTYLDYTDVPNGAMYGTIKDINCLVSGSVSCKTSIPNLMLAGQSVIHHGLFGVLAGSFVTCSEVLSTKYLFSQLTNSV